MGAGVDAPEPSLPSESELLKAGDSQLIMLNLKAFSLLQDDVGT